MLSIPVRISPLLCHLWLLTFCRIMCMFFHPRYPLGCHRCGGLNTRLISFQEQACRTVLLIEPIRRRLRRFSGKSKTVGDVTPGYPRGGPKCTRPDRVGRADRIPADSIRTVRRARLQEASSGVGIGPDLPCTARDIVVTD